MRYKTLTLFGLALVFAMTGLTDSARAQSGTHETTAGNVDVLAVDYFTIITPETSEDADKLIDRIEETALEMRHNAARLKSFTRVPDSYSVESHASRLNRIRDNLNDIARTLDRLEENTEFLLPRQSLTVGYVADELPTLAANLEFAIQYVNEDASTFWTDEYAEPVARIYDSADTIVEAAGLAEDLESSAFDENSDD